MFFSKTPLSFTPFSKGFFAAYLLASPRQVFLSGLSVGSTKSLLFCAFDFSFAVALKSAGTYVIPVLTAMGGTK
ncbi:MAG: hypothetical protein ABL869_07960 [Candidatus Nitrotoga sp.]